MMKLVPTTPADTERLEAEDTLALGQWFWIDRLHLHALENNVAVEDVDAHYVERLGRRVLACVSELGTNYAEVTYRGGGSERIHFDHFEFVTEREHDPTPYIQRQIEKRKENVRELMDEIRRVTAQLGITHRESLAAESDASAPTTALAAASGVADIASHKALLVRTKEEVLPDLFKRVEEEHEALAAWMKMPLLPMKAQLGLMKESIGAIEQRIFTVELYAGLVEKLERIRDGEPAPNDTKITLFQRRHYMDEECLLRYEAGGMRFEDIAAFDAWLCRPENLSRILPHARSVVAFRVRRHDRRGEDWGRLGDFIRFAAEIEAERATYLYIRNGEQVYRLSTEIKFDEQLFPDREHSTIFTGGELWMDTYWSRLDIDKIITGDEHAGLMRERAEERAKYESELAAWNKLSKKAKKESGRPWEPRPSERWERVSPESVHYDDAIKIIGDEMMKHNRIAVVLQGLLDRSPALQPHPPWQLWTPEGFARGIELIYDDSRAITSGEPPDFETYRALLNKSITTQSVLLGQEVLWEAHEAEKENARRDRSWRSSRRSGDHELKRFQPYGNPGPGKLARPTKVTRTGKATFEWTREKQGREWEDHPDKPGWLRSKRVKSRLPCSFTCSTAELFNVSAYTSGDYRLFFDDPRTREKYLQWAPAMLTAEDFHAGKRKVGNKYEIAQRTGKHDEDE